MKLIQKLAVATIAIFTVNYNAAASMSNAVPIIGGTIPPNGMLALVTDKLDDDVSYTLTCIIRNTNHNAAEKTDFSLYTQIGTPFIDNKKIANDMAEVSQFYSKGSILKITPIKKIAKFITIKNLDFTGTILVANCSAFIIGK